MFVALTRPGVPGDLEGAFNGLLRIKVKLPGTKKGGKEVEATVQLRLCSGNGEEVPVAFSPGEGR